VWLYRFVCILDRNSYMISVSHKIGVLCVSHSRLSLSLSLVHRWHHDHRSHVSHVVHAMCSMKISRRHRSQRVTRTPIDLYEPRPARLWPLAHSLLAPRAYRKARFASGLCLRHPRGLHYCVMSYAPIRSLIICTPTKRRHGQARATCAGKPTRTRDGTGRPAQRPHTTNT
jgi:hypothetical protein